MRERSRSPSHRKESSRDYSSKDYSKRDYGYSRGRSDRSERGDRGDRGDRGAERGGRGGRGGRGRGRGGYGEGRRDYGSRRGGYGSRDYGSRRGGYSSDRFSSGGSDEYRLKTERNYDNSIFIGNIPFDCTAKDVERIFEGYDIVRADIVTNRGQSRGMATVEFSTKDEVKKAINDFDHYEYRSREIFVRQDYPPPSDKKREVYAKSNERYERSEDRYENKAPRERAAATTPKPGTEIFVGNLPFSINWQALKDLMRKAGEVVRADVRLDNWGKSRGFGTVVFNTPEEAEEAISMFQGYEIEGRKLDTRPGRVYNQEKPKEKEIRTPRSDLPKNSPFTENVVGDGEKSNTIYASNLPFVTVVDDLYELFETIGKVTRAEIQYTNQGKPSGNAVIEFELDELADLAIENLNNYNYGGRDLSISYARKSSDDSAPEQEVQMDEQLQESATETSDAQDAPLETQETEEVMQE